MTQFLSHFDSNFSSKYFVTQFSSQFISLNQKIESDWLNFDHNTAIESWCLRKIFQRMSLANSANMWNWCVLLKMCKKLCSAGIRVCWIQKCMKPHLQIKCFAQIKLNYQKKKDLSFSLHRVLIWAILVSLCRF